MPRIHCHACGRVYRLRPIWRSSRRYGLYCRCGNSEPLGASFWVKVAMLRLAFVAVGAAAGWALAVSDPIRFRLVASVAIGAAVGALVPELTRLRKSAKPKRGTWNPPTVPADSSEMIGIPREDGRADGRMPGAAADA